MLALAGIAAIFCRCRDDPAAANRAMPLLTLRWQAAVANAADGGASDPQAHLRPFRRGSLRSLGGESVLPVLLRRGVFPTCVGVRPFVTDALAPADGAREAQGAAAGELGGGDPDGRDEALRPRLCCDRYDRAAEGGDVSDRRQAAQPGARAAGAPG